MLDFSQAPHEPPAPQDDTEALRQYLIDTLETWLPRLIPNGRTHSGEFRAGSVHGDPGQSFSMRLRGADRGLWVDHASGEGGDVFTLLMQSLGCSFHEAAAQARDMAGLRMRATPVAQTRERTAEDDERVIRRILETSCGNMNIVERYLRGRAITIPLPKDLRAHENLWHGPTQTRHEAMVATVRNVVGAVIGLHRTYLQWDFGHPKQANVSPQKMMLGQCKGGAVHLAEPVDVLGVCEGIETGLSCMQMWPAVPVWAALSTSGMRALVVPPTVRRVAIFADFDEKDMLGGRPGTVAAEALAARLATEGQEARIIYPGSGFKDFNDELMGRCV